MLILVMISGGNNRIPRWKARNHYVEISRKYGSEHIFAGKRALFSRKCVVKWEIVVENVGFVPILASVVYIF